jgi:hypothetical protein
MVSPSTTAEDFIGKAAAAWRAQDLSGRNEKLRGPRFGKNCREKPINVFVFPAGIQRKGEHVPMEH